MRNEEDNCKIRQAPYFGRFERDGRKQYRRMIETKTTGENDMTKGTKNHDLQKVVGLLVERSVVGDDDAYLTGEI